MVLDTALNKMKDEKNSIVKEALADYKNIQQAADTNAKKRLADEFPKEFNNILKEELNKNKPAKESNVDNAGINKELIMKNQSQTGLNKGLPFTNKAKVLSKDFAKKVNEDETVDETVGDSQPFDKKSKVPAKDVTKDISEERETSYMADLETQTPNHGKGEAEKGKIYNEKLVGPSSGKPIANAKKGVSENFNLSGNDAISVNKSLDNSQPMDELLTMEQIEEEINAMSNVEEDFGSVNASANPNQNGNEGGNPYQELVEMRNKLDSIIKGGGMNEMHQGNFTTANINKMHQGDYDSKLIDEDENPPQDKAFPPTKMKTGKNPNNNIYRGNEPKGVNEDENPPQDKAFPPTKMQTGKNPNANIYRGNEPKNVNEDENPPQDTAFPPTKMKTGKNPNDNIYRGNEPKGVDEMHQGNFTTANINKMHQGDYDSKLIDEYSNNMEISEEDINAVLGGANEAPVDESHGLTNRKNMTGRHTPAPEYLGAGERARLPQALRTESEKKISGLIEENKKLTKKINETKKYKETVTVLVESYKSALDKYRGQLKEMAVFNTNLSHVNNLLVNEELALTQEDKIKIINEFKKVDNIVSSQKVYKNLLTEMKGGKKTLTESIESKVSASIQPSSKQKLNEVIEKTAYADDKHIQRMKKIIETIEHRGKKII